MSEISNEHELREAEKPVGLRVEERLQRIEHKLGFGKADKADAADGDGDKSKKED